MTLPDFVSMLAEKPAFFLRNARLADPSVKSGLATRDLVVRDGRIAAISEPGSVPAEDGLPEIDLALAMVLPLPVDCHTHLDKGQIWARTPNRDHTFETALEATTGDVTAHQTADDVRHRLEFMLDCAEAHGTRAIRSHVDADPARFDATFEVMSDAAKARRDHIDLQLAPFAGIGAEPSWLDHLAKKSAEHDGILSLFLFIDPALGDTLAKAFDLAEHLGLTLDFHADENIDPSSLCLEAVAETMITRRFEGRVLVGHCCSLAVQNDEVRERVLEKCARAGLSIVALPACNAYLLDRQDGRTPRLRGVAPLHEIRAAGVDVALASDNCRDPFHAYGDLDMVDLFRTSLPHLHIDDDPATWLSAICDAPARAMGLAPGAIAEGAPADFIILPARNWSEFGARPVTQRILVKNGVASQPKLPDFSRLDQLEGIDP